METQYSKQLLLADLEELGYFLFMESEERKQKESSEEGSDAEGED